MSDVVICGIKNCDTMKKAMTWLSDRSIDYSFHDYKKQGVEDALLRQAIQEHGWEAVINRRGTTWRKLPDDQKSGMDEAGAVAVATANPSIIRRPLLLKDGKTHLGFSEADYSGIFG